MTTNDDKQLPPTEMIYFSQDGNFKLECDSKILSCQFIDSSPNSNNDDDTKKKTIHICLDKTVMHAQGGGQPTDIGEISINKDNDGDNKKTISIEKVLLDRSTGIATHTGTISNDDETNNTVDVAVGDTVHVSVNESNRKILSECHTAGHVVDSAMARCNKLLPPSKGYHFLDGPYVEYKGTIPVEERNELLSNLQKAFQDLVQEDIETAITVVPEKEALDICNRVAENYFTSIMNQFANTQDNTVRIVTVAGWPCPCGGTHVQSTGQLSSNEWGITGIKCKKGVVRIKYGRDWSKSKK